MSVRTCHACVRVHSCVRIPESMYMRSSGYARKPLCWGETGVVEEQKKEVIIVTEKPAHSEFWVTLYKTDKFFMLVKSEDFYSVSYKSGKNGKRRKLLISTVHMTSYARPSPFIRQTDGPLCHHVCLSVLQMSPLLSSVLFHATQPDCREIYGCMSEF